MNAKIEKCPLCGSISTTDLLEGPVQCLTCGSIFQFVLIHELKVIHKGEVPEGGNE